MIRRFALIVTWLGLATSLVSYSLSKNIRFLKSFSKHEQINMPPNFKSQAAQKNRIVTIRASSNYLKSSSKNIYSNIPNILTIGRVLSIPIFVVALIMGRRFEGVLIYIIAAITDLLDGYIARKLDQTSEFGAFLDPVADKLMVSTSLILLVAHIPTCKINTNYLLSN